MLFSGLELKRLSVIVGEGNSQFSLLLINVYLAHEDDSNSIHELGLQLAVIEDLINSNPNCYII